MTCPMCFSTTKIIDTTTTDDCVYRRRRCDKCGYRFNTQEVESNSPHLTRHQLKKEANK